MLLVLKFVASSDKSKSMICSDFLSCLLAIKSCQTQNAFILRIAEIYKSRVTIGKHVVDQEAKDAIDDPVSSYSIPYTDLKPFIMKHIVKRWQDNRDQQIHNKLHDIHSLFGGTPFSYGQSRKEQVVLTRCRIGLCRLAHSYLLNNEERPECISCNSNYSLKHVLVDCVDVSDIRQTFYKINNLYD
jgi:hypothetical protein